jgi:hypothetical protein
MLCKCFLFNFHKNTICELVKEKLIINIVEIERDAQIDNFLSIAICEPFVIISDHLLNKYLVI